jgi:hypothetical protein
MGNLDRATTAATLPTTRLTNIHTSQARGLTKQCARWDAHWLLCDIKSHCVFSHEGYFLPFSIPTSLISSKYQYQMMVL